MSDILKKPVHEALHKDSLIQKVSDKFDSTPVSVNTPDKVTLPKKGTAKVNQFKVSAPVTSIIKQSTSRVKLNILYDSIPKLPEDKIPDCSSCVAACCRAFIVELTEDEYLSGSFGEYAIKISPEISKQFQSKRAISHLAVIPQVGVQHSDNKYYLEGELGQPCPFLSDKNTCSIYDVRPATCRLFTCVGDSRITDEMKAGTEPTIKVMTNIIGIK